jgi:glycosyltransferase involved in cell wall biosynthesis
MMARMWPKKRQKWRAIAAALGRLDGERCLEVSGADERTSACLRACGGVWSEGGRRNAECGMAQTAGVVVVADVLEHVADDAALMAAAVQRLAPRGRLIISAPLRRPPPLEALARRLGLADTHFGHRRPGYTMAELRALVADAGAVLESVTTIGGGCDEVLELVANALLARRAPRMRSQARPPGAPFLSPLAWRPGQPRASRVPKARGLEVPASPGDSAWETYCAPVAIPSPADWRGWRGLLAGAFGRLVQALSLLDLLPGMRLPSTAILLARTAPHRPPMSGSGALFDSARAYSADMCEFGDSKKKGSRPTCWRDRADLAGRLRVLMVAPEPVFRPRGTPLSVVARIRALAALGCRVDLLTYPFGDPLDVPGVDVARCGARPVRSEPKEGPSLAKIALDWRLCRLVRRRLAAGSYDLVWAHEEAAYFAADLARRRRLPLLYDMHSSLAEQMVNYGWFRPQGLALRLARRIERRLLRRCDAVIAVCPAVADVVRAAAPATPVVMIENPPLTFLLDEGRADATPVVPGRVLYAGNLAPNQGIELLLAAMPLVRSRMPKAHLVAIGGRPPAARKAAELAARLGAAVDFRGVRPLTEVLDEHRRAAVLVSPRTAGSNVPSKVYTYLAVGRPIVATDIAAHRQVLDETCAVLVSPNSDALAGGILRVLQDESLAARLARAGPGRLAQHFTPDDYVNRVRQAARLALSQSTRRPEPRRRT